MIVETTKTLSEHGFSAAAIKIVVAHLELYAEDVNITFLKKESGVYSFSYEKRIKCQFNKLETKDELVVFIPGDDYVSTVIVTKKFPQTTKESTMSENTNTNTNTIPEGINIHPAEHGTIASKKTAGFINALTKTATYVAAATAAGFVGYYAWKKFGNKAE